jgi:hypothetical protein
MVVPGIARDPFAEPAPLSPVERDSVLSALSTMTPEVAAHARPTSAEVDSAAKEATLKMRLAGRRCSSLPTTAAGGHSPRPLSAGHPRRSELACVASTTKDRRACVGCARARFPARAPEDSLERSSTRRSAAYPISAPPPRRTVRPMP